MKRRRRRFSKRLQIYIFWEIMKMLVLIFAGFQVVLGSVFSIKVVRDYGVDMGILLPLIVPALAASLNAALPVSLLFATTLVYGRLTAEREIAALKSFGFSYAELAFLPTAVGASLTVVVLFLNFYVIPDLRFTRDNLGGLILERLRYLGEGWNQSFTLGDRHTLWIEHYDGSRLKGIFIASEASGPLGVEGVDREIGYIAYPLVIYAEEGEVVTGPEEGDEALYIELRNISIFLDSEYLNSKVKTDFKQQVFLGTKRLPVVVKESNKSCKELPLPALLRKIAQTRQEWEELRARGLPERGLTNEGRAYFAAATEIYRRINLAFMALTFPLAGVCIALFLNSPNRLLPVFTSLMVVPPIFYVLEMWGSSYAYSGQLIPFTEMVGTLGLLVFAAGFFLILRKRTLW